MYNTYGYQHRNVGFSAKACIIVKKNTTVGASVVGMLLYAIAIFCEVHVTQGTRIVRPVSLSRSQSLR
jgi:hypothetical protein